MKECSLSLSLSFLLLSLHHLYSLTLRQIWERTLTYTRTQTQTNWAKPISRLDWTCFPAGRMTAEVIFLHLAVPAFDRSRTCLCSLSLSLARLLVPIFGVLWQPVTLHMWFYRDNQSWSKTPLFPIQGNFLKFVLCVIWPWLKVMNKPGRQNKMNKALSVLYWVLIM